jgi:hypothetical protein
MRARLNGTKDPFVEIKEVSLADKPYVVYTADRIEFEQQQATPDHWQDVREKAAIAAMQGFIAHGWDDSECIVKRSIRVADALVEKLKGE